MKMKLDLNYSFFPSACVLKWLAAHLLRVLHVEMSDVSVK